MSLTQKEKKLAGFYSTNYPTDPQRLGVDQAYQSVCDGLKAAVMEELQNLEECCKQLSVRLTPVCKPPVAVPATTPTSPKHSAGSALGQWLTDLQRKLSTCNQDLRDLIGLLEI